MNTTAKLKDYILSSVTTATGITNTDFGYLWNLDTMQNPYPYFFLQDPINFNIPTLRTSSGVIRVYDVHLWFFAERGNSYLEDVYTTLENYALASLAEIEKQKATVYKYVNTEYKFEFFPIAGSDRVVGLEVTVSYAINQCIDLT